MSGWPTFFKLAKTKQKYVPPCCHFSNSPESKNMHPLVIGMPYFFQTRQNQKSVTDRYTNYPLFSIPSWNRFFDSSKLTPQNWYLVPGWPTFYKLAWNLWPSRDPPRTLPRPFQTLPDSSRLFRTFQDPSGPSPPTLTILDFVDKQTDTVAFYN